MLLEADNECPSFPDISEKLEYPGLDEYRGECHMGYFKGITIDADYFACYVGIIYLLIQILILIDWAWVANEWSICKSGEYVESSELDEEELINNYNCFKNQYDLARAFISIALYIGSFILIGFLFDWFGESSCSTREALIAITIVILAINFIGSGTAGGGTFSIAVIMSTCAMVLLYPALSATESSACNEFYGDLLTLMWLGIAFALTFATDLFSQVGFVGDIDEIFYDE